jgi:hypothetical protein
MTLRVICIGLDDDVANVVVVELMVVAAAADEAMFEVGTADEMIASNVELGFVAAAVVVVGGIVFVTSSVGSLFFGAAVSAKLTVAHLIFIQNVRTNAYFNLLCILAIVICLT